MGIVRIIFLILFAFGYFLFSLSVKATDQNLVLNEIMARPDDDTEWVEIYNPTNQTVDLTGWKVKDGNTSSTDDLSLSGQIDPLGFKVFEHTKGWLNDSGDETVTLLNDTTSIDSYSYSGAAQGKTFGRQPDGNSWESDLISTKNTSNGNPPTPTPSPTSTPTETPTPTSSPTSTQTPAPTKTPTPTKAPTSTSVPSKKPISISKPSPMSTEKSSVNLPASILGTNSATISPDTSSLTKEDNQTKESLLKKISTIGGILILLLSVALIATFIVRNRSLKV